MQPIERAGEAGDGQQDHPSSHEKRQPAKHRREKRGQEGERSHDDEGGDDRPARGRGLRIED